MSIKEIKAEYKDMIYVWNESHSIDKESFLEFLKNKENDLNRINDSLPYGKKSKKLISFSLSEYERGEDVSPPYQNETRDQLVKDIKLIELKKIKSVSEIQNILAKIIEVIQ